MLVRSIVEAARRRLGDSDNTGWSDTRLVELVNEAQRDICISTSVYRRETYIELVNNQELYPLPLDCYDVVRLEYMGKELPILSREDAESKAVRADMYAVKSNLNKSLIEIKPAKNDIPMNELSIVGTAANISSVVVLPPEGVTANTDNKQFKLSQPDGVAVTLIEDISCHPTTNFGSVVGSSLDLRLQLDFTSGIYDKGVLAGAKFNPQSTSYGFVDNFNQIFSSGVFGLTTNILVEDTYIKVFYRAVPYDVKHINDTLVLDDLWYKALVHYTVGMARQDDNDEGNYALGEAELKKYAVEVKKAQKLSAKSFTSQVTGVRETVYRGLNKYAGGLDADY